MRAMSPTLQSVAQSVNYGDLPELWRVPKIETFSEQKKFYDYQVEALRNAARALYMYYAGEYAWDATESLEIKIQRKRNFSAHYGDRLEKFLINQYKSNADRNNQRQNPVFSILSEYIDPEGVAIPYHHLINRMCFWMATGSGKTLVMVKIIEYLHWLRRQEQIPPYNILILAPNEAIQQIRRTVDEFNQTNLSIDLVPLREMGQLRNSQLGESVTVYFHRSDNISDVQKEALTDYRQYENDGQWYVLLDEAHKGGSEDSKRQAYYALMARQGFLFNFSATFTDPEDIATTVKKHNLEEFINDGYGKNLYLNESEYKAFKARKEEVSGTEKIRIVMKSLITLANATMQVKKLRQDTGQSDLYHLPLMLTLVNSVNTDTQDDRNDLWVFFQTLRRLAEGDIENSFFVSVKDELLADWREGQIFFATSSSILMEMASTLVTDMTIGDLREAVFLSRTPGALQFIRSKVTNKELAFQLVNADEPFAMIKIGDTGRWKNEFLVGFQETVALQQSSFFDNLDASNMTILMGSRAFFESWDSKRPNVINFINIGGRDAKKFVVQAIGRGVRIEPIPGQRRRLTHIGVEAPRALQNYYDQVAWIETLFVFATNRSAIKTVLEGVTAERSGTFRKVDGFKESKRPQVNGKILPLLVPEYRKVKNGKVTKSRFTVSSDSISRLKTWLENTADSVLMVRDKFTPQQVKNLRRSVSEMKGIVVKEDKDYAKLSFLQNRLMSHIEEKGETIESLREMREGDIVHFREVQALFEDHQLLILGEKIQQVAENRVEGADYDELLAKHARGEISREDFESALAYGKPEEFSGLTIKHIAEHYYVPVILADADKFEFVKHVIKIESEKDFLADLENWLKNNRPAWDAWMFSKIDESLDQIYIPYFDGERNEYRQFLPDFIFWMCRKDQYQIVFVDPKGMAQTAVNDKIDGYAELFEKASYCRTFSTSFALAKKVTVKLVLYNPEASTVHGCYARYWHDDPQSIFS